METLPTTPLAFLHLAIQRFAPLSGLYILFDNITDENYAAFTADA